MTQPLCPNGGVPKPSTPEWSNFEAADIASFLPPIAGVLALAALGLSTAPFATTDF